MLKQSCSKRLCRTAPCHPPGPAVDRGGSDPDSALSSAECEFSLVLCLLSPTFSIYRAGVMLPSQSAEGRCQGGWVGKDSALSLTVRVGMETASLPPCSALRGPDLHGMLWSVRPRIIHPSHPLPIAVPWPPWTSGSHRGTVGRGGVQGEPCTG